MFGLVGQPTPKPSGGVIGGLKRLWKSAGTPDGAGRNFWDKLGLIGAGMQDIDGGNRAGMMRQESASLQQDAERRRAMQAQEEERRAMREQVTAAADELGLSGAEKFQFITDPEFRRQRLTPKKPQYFNTREGIVGEGENGLELMYDLPDEAPEAPKDIEGPDGIYRWDQAAGKYNKVASFGAAPKVFAPQRGGGGKASGGAPWARKW